MKKFANTLLLHSTSIHSTDYTFRVPCHELFIAQKKKRCREVNRGRNTNNILLPLLLTIKRCLSISLKTSVQIRHTIGTASAMSGSKRH